jgi:hypothetical protein
VNEPSFLEADLDKGRLHAWKHASDAPFINVACDAALLGAFDVNFYERLVFQ